MDVKQMAPEAVEEQPLSLDLAQSRKRQKRRITVFVVVSVANVALLVLLWTQLLTPSRQALTTNTSDSTLTGNINSPMLGKAAPDFRLQSLTGTEQISLSDFKGKPVILNFWDSACEPCQQEAPFLQKAWQERLQAQGIVFIGIGGPERSLENARKFLTTYHISYKNVLDTTNGATGINYGVTGHPETIFIDKNGLIAAKWIAPLTEQGLEQELGKIR